MTDVTSDSIREKIAALDGLAVDLGDEFDKAAMEAVAGVNGAGKKAADINQRLERLAVDRRILSRALERALDNEADAAEAEAAAERKRHFEAAQGHAARLIEAAREVDAAITALSEALHTVGEMEIAVRQDLGRARAWPGDGVTGRTGLALMAVDRITQLTDGRARLRGPGRSIEDIAARAWDFLLEGGEHG